MVSPVDNLLSLQSQSQINQSKNLLSLSLERLITGKRLNTDSPADFAIGTRLSTSLSSSLQSIQNANDATSVAQTAGNAVAVQSDLLSRGRALALKAANGSLSDRDRGLVQNELSHILESVSDIAQSSSFNGINLLDGSFNSSFQIGDEAVDLSISSTLGSSLGAQELSSTGSVVNNDVSATGTAAINNNGVAAQTLTLGDESIAIAANASAEEIAAAINSTEQSDIKAQAETQINVSVQTTGGSLSITLGSGGSAGVSNAQTFTAADTESLIAQINEQSDSTGVRASFVEGSTTEFTLTSVDAVGNTAGNNIQISDISGFDADLTSVSTGNVTSLSAGGTDSALITGEVNLQSQSNASFSISTDGSSDIFSAQTNPSSLNSLDQIDVSTQSGAQDALAIFDSAIDQLAGTAAGIGAFENKVASQVDNLTASFAQESSALGRKVDTDFASEITQALSAQFKFEIGAAVLGLSGNTQNSFLSLLQR